MTMQSSGPEHTILVDGLVGERHEFSESQLRLRATAEQRSEAIVSVSVDDLLAVVIVHSQASHVSVISDDGGYTASIPLDEVRSGGRIHLGAAESVPRDAGGPFRLIVDGGQTLCWNVKSVGELRCTSGPEPDDVPEYPRH